MKFFLSIVLFLFLNASFSQGFSVGLKGGLNYTNFRGQSLEGLNFSNATNFHIGAAAQIDFSDKIKLQADLLYNIVGTDVKTLLSQYNSRLGYMSVPVAIKYAVFTSKTFLEGGVQMSYLVNEDQQALTAIGSQDWQTINKFDFAVFVGFSVNLTNSIFLQGRYHWGLIDAKSINSQSFKNQGATLSVGYFIF
jgi:hypothetical protein